MSFLSTRLPGSIDPAERNLPIPGTALLEVMVAAFSCAGMHIQRAGTPAAGLTRTSSCRGDGGRRLPINRWSRYDLDFVVMTGSG
jgi:hypothetical protein